MRKVLYVCLAIAAGCTPDLPRDEPGSYVVALFDPTAAPPVFPLPSGLAFLLDPTTTALAISARTDAMNWVDP